MRAHAFALLGLAACATDPVPQPGDELPACASDQLAKIVRLSRSFVPNGSVAPEHYVTARNVADQDVLVDGPEIFPKMRELIAAARYEVDLQTYVWEPNTDPSNEILAGLRDLAARHTTGEPVHVRFLFDVSTLNFGSTIDALPQTWATVTALDLDPHVIQFELAGFYHTTFGNEHAKTVVVDGREAIVTGANPQAHHDYAEPWRDAGYHVSGDVAAALQDNFDDGWRRGQLWTCGSASGTATTCSGAPTPIEHRFPAVEGPADACVPMLVTDREADPTVGTNRLDSSQDQAFLAAFGAATDHIRIQSPNLNDDAAKQAVLEAVQRGVRVDIVLSKGFNDSTEALPGQGGDNDSNVTKLYDALADQPDACQRLRIRWYARDGVPVVGNGVYASHAKYASLDDAIVIVGSANMDTQSWNNAREVNVVVDDARTTQAWDRQLFLPDFDGGVTVDRCAGR